MSKHKTAILYIDDEENNLIAFRASFRRDFDIFVTDKASDAVQILSENTIHLIVADQKMPDISGVEFLELVRAEYPDPIRILLTGYADIEAVIDAINRGQVYRYINKPWDENELRMIFSNAREYYDAKTDLKRTNLELQRAYGDLERFVYSASHDLRAPMKSILGVMDVIRQENAPERIPDYLSMIEKSVFRLDHFTQNMIHFYHNLKEEVKSEPILLEQWLGDIERKATKYANPVKLKLEHSLEVETIVSDSARLEIALINILSNAVVHGAAGKSEVEVRVRVFRESDRLVFSIVDGGAGIMPRKLQQLRETLEQRKPYEAGTGLGLYIVREVMDKLGGTLNLQSTQGKGTEVRLSMPE